MRVQYQENMVVAAVILPPKCLFFSWFTLYFIALAIMSYWTIMPFLSSTTYNWFTRLVIICINSLSRFQLFHAFLGFWINLEETCILRFGSSYRTLQCLRTCNAILNIANVFDRNCRITTVAKFKKYYTTPIMVFWLAGL